MLCARVYPASWNVAVFCRDCVAAVAPIVETGPFDGRDCRDWQFRKNTLRFILKSSCPYSLYHKMDWSLQRELQPLHSLYKNGHSRQSKEIWAPVGNNDWPLGNHVATAACGMASNKTNMLHCSRDKPKRRPPVLPSVHARPLPVSQ